MISWYPVIEVLKQTSPTAWPAAPTPLPQKTVPSASTSAAVAQRGAASFAPAVLGEVMMILPVRAARAASPRTRHGRGDRQAGRFVTKPPQRVKACKAAIF